MAGANVILTGSTKTVCDLNFDTQPPQPPGQTVHTHGKQDNNNRRCSRRPQKMRISLCSIPELLGEGDDVEVGRSESHVRFYAPDHYGHTPPKMSADRPVSLITHSSQSCYSLPSATSFSAEIFPDILLATDTCLMLDQEDDSLCALISSDVFLPTFQAPSANNTPVLGDTISTFQKGDLLSADVQDLDGMQPDAARIISSSSTLAARRGFKGQPLSLQANTPTLGPTPSKKFSSPTSPSPVLSSPMSPRTPSSTFVTSMIQMTNFLSPKTPSSKNFGTPSSASTCPLPGFPQHIQDDYTHHNPFAVQCGSYYAPAADPAPEDILEDPQENLYDFACYGVDLERRPTASSTLIRGLGTEKRTGLGIELGTGTSIYNLSIEDVCNSYNPRPEVQPPSTPKEDTRAKEDPKIQKPRWFPEDAYAFTDSPRIDLTPPTAPSSPRRFGFHTARNNIPNLLGSGMLVSPAPRIPGLGNSALRPLILPLHVAKRQRSRELSDPISSPCPRPVTARGWPAPQHVSRAIASAPPPRPVSLVDSELPYYTAPSTPFSTAEESPLNGIPEVDINQDSLIAAVEDATAGADSQMRGSPSSTSSMERKKRRSRAVVDILSLLDAAAAGAAQALDAINCEDEGEVDIGDTSVLGLGLLGVGLEWVHAI